MDRIIDSWMAKNRVHAEELALQVTEIEAEFIEVKVRGYMIQVSIPCNFQDVNSDGFFAAVSLEDGDHEELMEALLALNEKLERIKITPDCLDKVFDSILQVFQKDKCKRPKRTREDFSRQELGSYVTSLAEGARVECEKALETSDEVLPWCSVRLIPGLEVVELEVELQGVMPRDNVTTGLGFCLDYPLIIHLIFGNGVWFAEEALPVDSFRNVEVFVKQNPAQVREVEEFMEKVLADLDEKIRTAVIKSCPSRTRQYGPHVMVPEFVKGFFRTCQVEPGGLLKVNERVVESSNIFVALLISLGAWLKTLRNRCVVCKNRLPPFSRLWYCDAELCLYRFEELGIGASVLQELQNSELIDLELTLAAAATRKIDRDVFEPYPAFLLKKEEIRKRSGFFSNYKYEENRKNSTSSITEKHLDNKNLELMKQLIDSFPPLSEMQQCSNEIELVVKLGISWLQKKCDFNSTNGTDVSQEDYAEKIWLPYKLLRYVLFTNRSSLHLLQDSHKLNIHGSLYQFAVFYNSESEQNFEQRRKTEQSVFAFHGSSIWNWYSIIRNGLRCLSNTTYMSTGMAYGQGIYFSPDMDCSRSYCGTDPWSIHGKIKDYAVLAICEIFSGQNHHKANNNFFVIPPKNENDVVIRYLIVVDPKEERKGHVRVTNGHILSDAMRSGGHMWLNQYPTGRSGFMASNLTATDDHMSDGTGQIQSQNTNLYEHYRQLRIQYFQEVENGRQIPNNQLLDLFQKTRRTTQKL